MTVEEAAKQQRLLSINHIHRLREQLRARYPEDTLQSAGVTVQIAAWQHAKEILDAILDGKTVQPS